MRGLLKRQQLLMSDLFYIDALQASTMGTCITRRRGNTAVHWSLPYGLGPILRLMSF